MIKSLLTTNTILNKSFNSDKEAVEGLANLVLNSGINNNSVKGKIDALINTAFPQKEIAELVREDLPNTSWDKIMKLSLYTFFAAGGGVRLPEEVINRQFVVADERMVPELAYYQFVGNHVSKRFESNDSAKILRELTKFLAKIYNDKEYNLEKLSIIKRDMMERIKVHDLDKQDPIKHTNGAIQEAIEVLKFLLQGKNNDLPILVSRACKEVLDKLADKYPVLAEEYNLITVVVHPNDVRHFYSQMGMEELTFLSKVFSGLNPSNKKIPIQLLHDGEGYYRLVFDEDLDKTVNLEPRGGGYNGHVVRLADGSYIQPIKVVTAAGQVGQVPEDDEVGLDSVGTLVYYLATYAITTVGGRSEVDGGRNSNKDNNGSNRIGEDIYRAIETACENEGPEYLLCSGSVRDDVQRFYFSDLINWFPGSHFHCQNGKLKFLKTLNGDKIRSRLNIFRNKLGEFGTNDQIKVEGVDKSQVVENLVNQDYILSTKNNTCLHGETMMLKGNELSEEECKSLLMSLTEKGKKALISRLSKDGGYSSNPEQFFKDNGGEEVVLEALARDRDRVCFL